MLCWWHRLPTCATRLVVTFDDHMLTVLYEDNHLLAVVKPVGLPTMGVAAGKPSLIALAKEYVKEKYDKPGNVYLGIVSRLDSLTSGVVVSGPHVEGRRAAQRAIPRAHGREDLLGHSSKVTFPPQVN